MDKDMVHAQHPEVKYMPHNFAIYQELLDCVIPNVLYYQINMLIYFSVTIYNTKGLLVGNFHLLIALPHPQS